MRFYGHERLALVVDGPNTFHACQNIGLEIDYSKLQKLLARQATLTCSLYFTSMNPDADGFVPHKPLIDWLDYNGWQVIAREKDPDVDLAVMAMELAQTSIDHFVIASGDGDFVILVEALQRRGKHVTILSSLKGGGLSDDLRRAADDFMDLSDLRSEIARPAKALKETVTV
jgi:uncharacterized protein (TIGR00288 family)